MEGGRAAPTARFTCTCEHLRHRFGKRDKQSRASLAILLSPPIRKAVILNSHRPARHAICESDLLPDNGGKCLKNNGVGGPLCPSGYARGQRSGSQASSKSEFEPSSAWRRGPHRRARLDPPRRRRPDPPRRGRVDASACSPGPSSASSPGPSSSSAWSCRPSSAWSPGLSSAWSLGLAPSELSSERSLLSMA